MAVHRFRKWILDGGGGGGGGGAQTSAQLKCVWASLCYGVTFSGA